MIRPIVLACLVILASAPLWSAPIGRVTFLEGDVTVVRDGKALEAEKLTEGMEIEADDQLVTGDSGRMEVLVDKATGVPVRFRLGTSTQVVVEITSAKRDQAATLALLGGSLHISVANVRPESKLVVRTALSSLVTRNGTFTITSALGGELAVATSAGRVTCNLDDVTSLSEAGTVLIITPRPLEVRSLPVNATTLDAWSQNWKAGMDADIRNRALATVKFFGARYQQESGEFQRAWERWLREGQKTWNLWRSQEASGKFSDKVTMALEKRVLGNLGVNLRQSGLKLETDAFELAQLRLLIQQGVLGDTQEMAKGYTIRDFYRQFDRDAPALSTHFALTRQLHKAYWARSGGDFPEVSGTTPEVSRDSPFFN